MLCPDLHSLPVARGVAAFRTVELNTYPYGISTRLLLTFHHAVRQLEPSGRMGDVVEPLDQKLRVLLADGNTARYDAMCRSAAMINELQKEDDTSGDNRLYGTEDLLLRMANRTNGRFFASTPENVREI